MQPTNCHLWSKNPPNRDELNTVFDTVETFDEDSHLRRSLLRCKKCQQLYFYAFDEEVDWKGGEDAQFRTWIPIASTAEAEALKDQSRMQFAKFSPRLEYAWPSDAESPTLNWIGKQA